MDWIIQSRKLIYDGSRGFYEKWNKLDRERQIAYDLTNMWNLKNKTNKIKQNKTKNYFFFFPCSACHSPVLISSALCLQAQVILAEWRLPWCIIFLVPFLKGRESWVAYQNKAASHNLSSGEKEGSFRFHAIFWGEEKLLKLSKNSNNVTTKSSWTVFH